MIEKGSLVKINTQNEGLSIFNGTLGKVLEIDFEEEYPVMVKLQKNGAKVIFTFNELEEIING